MGIMDTRYASQFEQSALILPSLRPLERQAVFKLHSLVQSSPAPFLGSGRVLSPTSGDQSQRERPGNFTKLADLGLLAKAGVAFDALVSLQFGQVLN